MQKIQLLKDNEQKEGQDKMLATSMVNIIHQGLRACESPSILINDGQTPIFIVTTVLVKPALVKLLITYSCNHCGIKVKIHVREGLNILLEDQLLEQTPFSKPSNMFGYIFRISFNFNIQLSSSLWYGLFRYVDESTIL